MKNINAMTEAEKKARAKAFDWIECRVWLTEEAYQYPLCEDLDIEEIIEWIEDVCIREEDIPTDIIKELRKVA